MVCPKCGSYQLVVVDSRNKPFGVQRRRECMDCGHRFNTAEIDMEYLVTLKCDACPWLK